MSVRTVYETVLLLQNLLMRLFALNLMLLLMLQDQGMSFSVDEIICVNFNG